MNPLLYKNKHCKKAPQEAQGSSVWMGLVFFEVRFTVPFLYLYLVIHLFFCYNIHIKKRR